MTMHSTAQHASRSCDEFWDRRSAFRQDWNRAAGKVVECDVFGVDAEMAIERREKIAAAHNAIGCVLTANVGRADDLSGFDAASGEQ